MGPSTSLRRQPVQKRSRERLERVLNAADRVLATRDFESFTIRAVSDESGVSAPAIYQWFADRDELAGALIERQLTALDQLIADALAAHEGDQVHDLTETLIRAHVDFYRANPSHVVLWFRGRVTPQVVDWVHHHSDRLARQLNAFSVQQGLIPPDTDPAVQRVLIEVADRVNEYAFRVNPDGDEAIIEMGIDIIDAYIARQNDAG